MTTRRGVWWFVLLLFFVGTTVRLAALALHEPNRPVPSAAVLVLDVPATLEESEPPHRPIPFGLVRRSRNTVYALVQSLDRAAGDRRVVGLVLHIGNVDWGWGKLAEVRSAVMRFRAAGKPVYAMLKGGGEAEFFLATSAGMVAMPPLATLQINGLALSATYLRGSLDKLDIHPNFAHAGRYKSAVETYTRGDMSPPSRIALQQVLDDVFSMLVDSLSVARDLPRDSVLRIIDEGPYGAPAAFACGLVDSVLYSDDLDSLAIRRAGRGARALSFLRYGLRPAPTVGPHVALVTGSGSIVPGKSRYVASEGQVMGTETMIESLREARERKSVKAVVLRIDTPGGEMGAADEIRREVKRCREAKPVVVSMSDYAASGGYFISAPATKIVAYPGTLTGSIGVYGGKFNILGLLHKLGLNVESVSRGRHAQMFSPFRDFSAEESARFQEQIDEDYRVFLSRVSEGRGLPVGAVDSVAQGRVWSGSSARACGLVDTLGDLHTAIAIALQSAGLEPRGPYVVDVYPRVERTLFDRALEEWLSQSDDEDAMEATLPPVVRAWVAAARDPAGSVLAVLPWSVEIR